MNTENTVTGSLKARGDQHPPKTVFTGTSGALVSLFGCPSLKTGDDVTHQRLCSLLAEPLFLLKDRMLLLRERRRRLG